MSDNLGTVELLKYVERLEQFCKPNSNDVRHSDYVRYINCFLTFFGKERVYLVGSTGEKSKLRWSTDGGDADFILVSGKIEIPVDQLEPRQEMPVYVWVRGGNLNRKFCGELVDEKYVCPEILRTVSPKLFTILRAVYLIVTATTDGIAGRESRVSTTAKDSKVGLAREEFRNLKIEGEEQMRPVGLANPQNERRQHTEEYLKHRWRTVKINTTDLKLIKRIFKMVGTGRVPGSRGQYFGNFAHFAYVAEAMLRRPPIDVENDEDLALPFFINELGMEESYDGDKIKATYSEKSSKDFVPAFRVDGILPCMNDFLERVRGKAWPSKELAETVYGTDVFVVSRRAPIKEEPEKDFCLSFNLAEIQLTQNLPGIAKKVFIILKAYLKGIFKREFDKRGKSLKLKTYHMKMVMFWICEQESLQLWEERNILEAVNKALDFLSFMLEAQCLEHYFVLSNLFVGFEAGDFLLLSEIVSQIQKNPVKSIECFFDMDDEVKGVTYLTPAEVENILAMRDDNGDTQFADQLEEAMLEMVRGFSDGPKNSEGNGPVREAILAVVDMFLEDEKRKKKPNGNQDNKQARKANDAQAVAGILNYVVTNGGTEQHDSSGARQRMDFLSGLASMFPEGRQILSQLGGGDGVMNVLRDTANEDMDNGEELKTSVEKLLTCSDEEEESVMLELKQKIASYFLGREEN